MKMVIEYNGKTYESPESDDATAAQIMDALYPDFEDCTKLKMELKGGGHLILGRDAVRSCVITIFDT